VNENQIWIVTAELMDEEGRDIKDEPTELFHRSSQLLALCGEFPLARVFIFAHRSSKEWEVEWQPHKVPVSGTTASQGVEKAHPCTRNAQ
jgi:hypothetical protein